MVGFCFGRYAVFLTAELLGLVKALVNSAACQPILAEDCEAVGAGQSKVDSSGKRMGLWSVWRQLLW